MNSESSQSNVLDVVIKYGAIFTAVAYAGGFAEHVVYVYRLQPIRDIPLSNPYFFAIGLGVLFAGFGPLALLAFETDRHPRTMMWFRLGMASGVFVCNFVWALWWVGAWVRDAVVMAAFGATLTILSYKAWTDKGGFFRFGISDQVRALYLMGLVFLSFAVSVGQVEWRSAMQHERGRKVRLLVAPDAVAGAEQLGFVFPKGSAPQSTGAALSAPIEIIDEGERTYTLRLAKTHFVCISKDKVLGFSTEP